MEKVFFKQRRGITSIEVVIGVSIAGIVIVFAANAVSLFINGAREVTEKTQALYLAEEGLELIRFMRDEDWNELGSLSTNAIHYLDISPTTVSTAGGAEVIGDFTRSFTVANVYRNGDDDIVASTTGGSTADTDAKYVTVTVSWNAGADDVSLSTILANIQE